MHAELGFDVLDVVMMLIALFWIETPCRLVGGYQCFRGTYIRDYRESESRRPKLKLVSAASHVTFSSKMGCSL
jgi:hypothetical protein